MGSFDQTRAKSMVNKVSFFHFFFHLICGPLEVKNL